MNNIWDLPFEEWFRKALNASRFLFLRKSRSTICQYLSYDSLIYPISATLLLTFDYYNKYMNSYVPVVCQQVCLLQQLLLQSNSPIFAVHSRPCLIILYIVRWKNRLGWWRKQALLSFSSALLAAEFATAFYSYNFCQRKERYGKNR